MRTDSNFVKFFKLVSCSVINGLTLVQKVQARHALLQSRIISCLTHKIGLMGKQWQLYSPHMCILPTRPGQKSHGSLSSYLQTVITPYKASQPLTISETDPALCSTTIYLTSVLYRHTSRAF